MFRVCGARPAGHGTMGDGWVFASPCKWAATPLADSQQFPDVCADSLLRRYGHAPTVLEITAEGTFALEQGKRTRLAEPTDLRSAEL